MTKNDPFALKTRENTADSDGDGVIDPWDCEPLNREAQGIFHSAAINLRDATKHVLSERVVEPAKAKVRAATPSKEDVIAGIKKAPGLALKAIDAMWANPGVSERAANDSMKPPSVGGEPAVGVQQSASRPPETAPAKAKVLTLDDILPPPPGW